jgi:hypothetical protein
MTNAPNGRPDLIAAARGLIGVPFELGGRDPARSLDCAGLVMTAGILKWAEGELHYGLWGAAGSGT